MQNVVGSVLGHVPAPLIPLKDRLETQLSLDLHQGPTVPLKSFKLHHIKHTHRFQFPKYCMPVSPPSRSFYEKLVKMSEIELQDLISLHQV